MQGSIEPSRQLLRRRLLLLEFLFRVKADVLQDEDSASE
jgi:hypothetical protein